MTLPAHIQRIKDELYRDMENPHDKSQDEYVRLLFVAWNDIQTLLKEVERLHLIRTKAVILAANLPDSELDLAAEVIGYTNAAVIKEHRNALYEALKPHDAQEGG
jgi:hypothetical protein